VNEVKVLIAGYAKSLSGGGWVASSTATLVTSDKSKEILVDPGANKRLLLERLSENSLKPDDIDIVFISHFHEDHCPLVALFTKADMISSSLVCRDDKEWEHQGFIPDTDIEILRTPGHGLDLASLVVKTADGIVVVASDVFWWEEGEEQVVDINKKDDFATDFDLLKESRRRVLKIADFIVPGHGRIFKVQK
jgi:glyoxylase-like metal-dependent hydrolase (beta-lactamase superfamily II)